MPTIAVFKSQQIQNSCGYFHNNLSIVISTVSVRMVAVEISSTSSLGAAIVGIGISFTFAKGMNGSMNAQCISSISWSIQSISWMCISISVISKGFSFSLTLNQKAMTMRISSSGNMGVKPESVYPRSEPYTIGVGPQNTRGVSLGCHHGNKTSNDSEILHNDYQAIAIRFAEEELTPM